jgi:hypothetical protein
MIRALLSPELNHEQVGSLPAPLATKEIDMAFKTYPKERLAHRNAIRRCIDPKDKSFVNYGARGIQFLFPSFEAFLADVGLAPSKKHLIDRIDNNLGYQQGNCRWVTQDVSNGNRRTWAKGSKYKGVFLLPSGRFHAQIRFGGKRICGPVVTTDEQAAHDYDNMVGTFGVERTLNFPMAVQA